MMSDSFGLLPDTKSAYEKDNYKGSDDYAADLEEQLEVCS